MWKLTSALLGAAFLAACGGGGGGGGDVAAPPPPPAAPASTNVEAAVRALVRASHSYALQGSTSTGMGLTASLSTEPGGTRSHQALNFDSSNLTLSIFSNSVLVTSTTVVLWYYPGTVNLRFSTDSADNSCNYYTAITVLPTAAGLGTAGAYFTATRYPGCTSPSEAGFLSFGTVTGTWSYSVVGSVPFVCINSATTSLGSTSTTAICAEITDANGTLGGRSRVVIRELNGVTTTLAN